MKITNSFLAVLCIFLALGGCATSRSSLDIAVPTANHTSPQNNKIVFIKSVADKRIFQTSPASPDIPSLDPSEEQSDAIRLRAIGRKRNGFGKALGDILVKEGQTIETMAHAAIAQAFAETGYRVISSKESVTNETMVIDADIEKFWAWMNMGFWAITLNCEISTDLAIKLPDSREIKKVAVKASDSYQVATEGNWAEIIRKALIRYIDELKSKIK